jgi:hypothetical protein
MYLIFAKFLDRYWIGLRYVSMDKKSYVIKNVYKSMILAVSMPLATILLINNYQNNYYEYLTLISAWIYGSVDIIGLINVNNLPITTKMHHMVVALITISITLLDNSVYNVATIFINYAAICTYTFSVNLFLGLRHIYIWNGKMRELRYLARISYNIYRLMFICIIANCIYHYYHMYCLNYNPYLIMTIATSALVLWRDDLILLSWLKQFMVNSRKKIE